MVYNNFDTINVKDKNMSSLDHISSYNVTDENENNQNKKLKISNIKNNLNINIRDNNNAIYENNKNQKEK